MLYLGCPNILNLQQMIDNGIFISDMSSHDLSRNIMFSNVEKHIEQCLMKNLEENSNLLMGVDSKLISIPTALGGEPAPEENALLPAPSGEERQGREGEAQA